MGGLGHGFLFKLKWWQTVRNDRAGYAQKGSRSPGFRRPIRSPPFEKPPCQRHLASPPTSPRPAIQYAARVTIQAAGVGFAMSAIQNALGKHSHGASGVFTRTGGTIGFFGAWPTPYCMGASRTDVRCLLSRQLLWERHLRSLKHMWPTCAKRTMLSTALLVDALPDSSLAYDVWLLFSDVLLSFDILLV